MMNRVLLMILGGLMFACASSDLEETQVTSEEKSAILHEDDQWVDDVDWEGGGGEVDQNLWEEEQPQIVSNEPFYLITPAQCQNPCRLYVTALRGISYVEYYAEEWKLGVGEDGGQNFELVYDFTRLGKRLIKAIAFDRNGQQVASAGAYVNIYEEGNGEIVDQNNGANQGSTSNQSTGFPLNVPYFYQYNNQYYPGSSCQNTSIAMVLKHYGWQGVPDHITAQYGKDYAQSPAGLADVFNTIASRNGLSKRIVPNTNGSIEGLKRELDAGHPVIIHGYFTRSGHVVVVVGYDSSGYWVNDPAGTWSQGFKSGYPNAYQESTAGKKIYYRKAAFESAVASDGYSYLPLWYHAIRSN